MLQISVEFSREVSNLSKLIFRSIPIEIYLLELKMKWTYAKRYFFLKTIRFETFQATKLALGLTISSFPNLMRITAEK